MVSAMCPGSQPAAGPAQTRGHGDINAASRRAGAGPCGHPERTTDRVGISGAGPSAQHTAGAQTPALGRTEVLCPSHACPTPVPRVACELARSKSRANEGGLGGLPLMAASPVPELPPGPRIQGGSAGVRREAHRGCGCILGAEEGVGKRREAPPILRSPGAPFTTFPGPSVPVEDHGVQGAGAGCTRLRVGWCPCWPSGCPRFTGQT